MGEGIESPDWSLVLWSLLDGESRLWRLFGGQCLGRPSRSPICPTAPLLAGSSVDRKSNKISLTQIPPMVYTSL